MREKLVFKTLKTTDHLCLQKTKKSKKQTQPRWKIAIFIKSFKEIDQWRLVKYYFKKVYVLHCRFSGWQTKTLRISLHWLTILFLQAHTREKFFIVLSTNMATLSHGRKLHMHYNLVPRVVFQNGSIRKEDPGTQQPKTNSFMDRDWPMAFIPR